MFYVGFHYILILLILKIFVSNPFMFRGDIFPNSIKIYKTLLEIKSKKINGFFFSGNSEFSTNLFFKGKNVEARISIPIKESIIMEFIDPENPEKRNKSIVCNSLYELEIDGGHYIFGTPLDMPIAIYYEGLFSRIIHDIEKYFIDTDIDNNIQILETGTAAFYQRFGYKNGIEIKHTPRILTLNGDLTHIIGIRDWETFLRLRDIKFSIKNIIKSGDENLLTMLERKMQDSFHNTDLSLDMSVKIKTRKSNFNYVDKSMGEINFIRGINEDDQIIKLFNKFDILKV